MTTDKMHCILFIALQNVLHLMDILNDKGLSNISKKNLNLTESDLLLFYNHFGRKTIHIAHDRCDEFLSTYNVCIRGLHDTWSANNLVTVFSMIEVFMEEHNTHVENLTMTPKLTRLFRYFAEELDRESIRDSKWAGQNLYRLLNSEDIITNEVRLERIKKWAGHSKHTR